MNSPIATPGTFCAAIVTMYNGIAMLTAADQVSVGMVAPASGKPVDHRHGTGDSIVGDHRHRGGECSDDRPAR